MDRNPGPTGIEGLGDLQFGTHFCLFYETKQDLLEILLDYFKAGMAKHEFCVWITSEANIDEARTALKQALPKADLQMEVGEIKIISFREWYLKDGKFNAPQVINGFGAMLTQAVEKGFSGVRGITDEAWLGQDDWEAFSSYERKLDDFNADKPMIILCAYPTQAHNVAEVLDLARTHNFTVAKRHGNWEILKTPELAVRKARDELEVKIEERTANLSKSNQALQAKIVESKQAEKALRESETKLKEAEQLAQIGYWERDIITGRITGSEGTLRIFGLKPDESVLSQAQLLEMIHPDDRQIQQQALRRALQGGQLYDVEYRIIRPDGDIRFLHVRDEIEYDQAGQPVRLFGALQDITERKLAEEEIRRNAARAQLLTDISQACDEAGLDYQRVIATITRRTAELIGDGCMITQLSEDRQRLRPVAFHHPNPQALTMMQEILTNAWTGSLDTPISDRLLAGEAVWMPDVTAKEISPWLSPQFQTYIVQIGISSLLAVPLRVQGQVIGILSLLRDHPGQPYTGRDQVLLQDIADRAALTIDNARLFQSVAQQRERLRALSVKLVEVQEIERRTIARELHNEIGQMLTGLQITLKMSSRLAPDPVRTSLEDAQKLTEQLLERVQDLSLDLRPEVLDDLGLMAALLSHFERYTHQTGIRVRFDQRGIGRRFSSAVETAAYRIIQEGLTNVARYAGVLEVAVRVWAEDGILGLQIEDKGKGFDGQSAHAAYTSSGLSGMQEQAELLSGRLTFESKLGAGTLITVELPLDGLRGEQNERDDIVG